MHLNLCIYHSCIFNSSAGFNGFPPTPLLRRQWYPNGYEIKNLDITTVITITLLGNGYGMMSSEWSLPIYTRDGVTSAL